MNVFKKDGTLKKATHKYPLNDDYDDWTWSDYTWHWSIEDNYCKEWLLSEDSASYYDIRKINDDVLIMYFNKNLSTTGSSYTYVFVKDNSVWEKYIKTRYEKIE